MFVLEVTCDDQPCYGNVVTSYDVYFTIEKNIM